jgi:hypothetical protein
MGAGPQDPQDVIEHGTVLPPRAPSTVFAARQLGQERPNEVQLLVREVAGLSRSREGHPSRMAAVRIALLTPTSLLQPQRQSLRS